MASAVLLSAFRATPDGHGGNHRSYQILQDLEAAVGPGNVTTLRIATAGDPGAGFPAVARPGLRLLGKVVGKLRLSFENPASLVTRNRFYSRCFTDRARVRDYRRLLASLQGPAVCVVEHAGLLDLVRENRGAGVATIACPQNLESLDTGAGVTAGRRAGWATAIDLANELRALATADRVLPISKVELALLSGAGIPGAHYPYVPSGEIAARLERVRASRASGGIDSTLLVLLGSAEHETSGESMRWLLEGIGSHPLLDSARVVVVGAGTQVFGDRWPSVEARGWVEQDELDGLLCRCATVLVPQRRGFGALTRLPELALAGVPTLASDHALAALDPPPGCRGVADRIAAWAEAILALRDRPGSLEPREYAAWAGRQARPLSPLVARLLEGSERSGGQGGSTNV